MKKIGILILVLGFLGMVSAAHWISGFSEDALDGTSVQGRSVYLWNPSVGTSDNVSDVVGVLGNSGVASVYLIDCEMLSAPCVVGDILSLKIIGDYVSWIVNVTVTGAGYDVVSNLSLNSPPSVSLIEPQNSGITGANVDFNCSFSDLDDNVERVALWGNWSGSWIEEDFSTSGLGGGSYVFNDVLTQGNYFWNCFVEDDLGIGSWAATNNTFYVDTTPPQILSVSSVSDVCGYGVIPVECSVTDNTGVSDVIIQATFPNSSLANYSASFVSGNLYRANVSLDAAGHWGFDCFANDSVGNSNFSSGAGVDVSSGGPDLEIIEGEAFFDKVPSVEGEFLNISVNVSNVGCGNSGNFVVGFFANGINFGNVTSSVLADESINVSYLWATEIGLTNISVLADSDFDISEDNESNNFGNKSAYLRAWQEVYGNVSLDLILGGDGTRNMSLWGDENVFAGNVFVVDSEADVSWSNLQAIGRDKDGVVSSGDFGEIDSLLGMSSYNDSVSSLFGSGGLFNFSVFGSDIFNVPYVNSSSNGNFITGILWDTSDSGDLEYDSTESEDVVFVARVNKEKAGSFGIYDYEISVPSKLRAYDSGDESLVYLYYDLR